MTFYWRICDFAVRNLHVTRHLQQPPPLMTTLATHQTVVTTLFPGLVQNLDTGTVDCPAPGQALIQYLGRVHLGQAPIQKPGRVQYPGQGQGPKP